MKSVGEVMAIGRTFQESLQKALRGLEVGVDGFNLKSVDMEKIEDELAYPRAERLWYVADAFGVGMSARGGPPLHEDRPVVPRADQGPRRHRARHREALPRRLRGRGAARRSSARASPTGASPTSGRRASSRCARAATPSASAPSTSAWTPARRSSPRRRPTSTPPTTRRTRPSPTDRRKIMMLGGGPNRIGQGIEFDYCCVHAALALREDGFETIMVNCNPETVSTDYDTSDRLYFEPLTLEDVLEIVDREKPEGVIVQFGGQTPLKLARDLEAAGVPIIGTSARLHRQGRGPRALPADAARAEAAAAAQPHGAHARGGARGGQGDRLPGGGAPLLRAGRPRDGDRARRDRPRALHEGGREGLQRFPRAHRPLPERRDRGGRGRGERRRGQVIIGGIMEHIEQAGVHSGDSACSLPPFSLSAGAAGRAAPPDGGDGEGAERRRPHERAVRDPGRQGLRPRGEPARLAHRPLRLEGDPHAARQGGRALHGGALARLPGGDPGGHPAVLLREGGRVPLHQVPRASTRSWDRR